MDSYDNEMNVGFSQNLIVNRSCTLYFSPDEFFIIFPS